MDTATTVDLLLAEADALTRRSLTKALTRILPARVSGHASARSALASYMRVRFEALVTGTELEDIDCWRLIRMIRSGRFGYPDMPVLLLCRDVERASLAPIIDSRTFLIDADSPEGAAEQIRTNLRQRHKPSVLIIEDEPLAASAAVRALEKHFEVEVAVDGESGLEAWRRKRPDVVVLDLMLPGLTGAEVLSIMLRDVPDQPVVILTAHDAPERHQELMLAGATQFLAKPVDLRVLADTCAAILREKRWLATAEEARAGADALAALAARVHAADYTLSCGRTAEASRHLRHALRACRFNGLSDDQWSLVMSEFSE